MEVYAAQLFRQLPFLYTVVVIQSCLSTPADVECGIYMRLGPFKYLTELVPVSYFFKFQLFHRRTCDDQSVEIPVLNIIKCLIKLIEMGYVNMGSPVRCCSKECDLELYREIREDSQYVEFGIFLKRHEVEYGDLQRSDILRDRAGLIHYKYIFIFQYLLDRKIILNLDRHFRLLYP